MELLTMIDVFNPHIFENKVELLLSDSLDSDISFTFPL